MQEAGPSQEGVGALELSDHPIPTDVQEVPNTQPLPESVQTDQMMQSNMSEIMN